MACEERFDSLSAFVDGELSGPELRELEAHLATCASCRASQDQLSTARRRSLLHPVDLQVDPAYSAHVASVVRTSRANRTLARRASAAAAAVVGLIGLAAPTVLRAQGGVSPAPELASPVVEAEQSWFEDGIVDVPAGSTVTWENRSGTTHRLVRQLDNAVVTGSLEPGQIEKVTFTEPGVYEFYCEIHDGMNGTVVVE